MSQRKYKIGVMGKAGRSSVLPAILTKSAEIIGKEIAKQGCVLITGACMGIPNIAAKSAAKAGGLVLGYSPAKNLKEHIEPPISYPWPNQNEELIFTGYGKIGRNVLSIFECDGLIFIGGGIGTLNEFSIAYHENKVIGILEGVGGITEKVLRLEKELKVGTGKKFKGAIIKEKDPKRLVKKVIEEIKKREEKPRKEIPLTFKNKRGKNLIGILHLSEKENSPLVIISHGYQGTKTDRKLIRLSRALAKERISVFRFDFEGCGDSEGEASEISVKREVEDLGFVFREVLAKGNFDSKRLAFIGYSLGGVITSFFLRKFKIPAKTLIFLSPAFNQKELLKIWYSREDLKKLQKSGFLIKGEKVIGKDYYLENKNKDYSSLLAKLNLPILIIHGKEDKDVPLNFSERLIKKYKNITLEILPKANHKFDDFSSQKKLIKLTVDWLKKYL